MCAKKSPPVGAPSPAKQPSQATKSSPAKKAPVQKQQQTTKNKSDEKTTSAIAATKSASTSVKKSKSTTVENESKDKPPKSTQSTSVKSTTKKITSHENLSCDNNVAVAAAKKKLPTKAATSGKTNRNKSNDSDKLSVNKSNSNHIKQIASPTKSAVAAVKGDECNKIEKSSLSTTKSVKVVNNSISDKKVGMKKSNDSLNNTTALNSKKKLAKSTTTTTTVEKGTTTTKSTKKLNGSTDDGQKRKKTADKRPKSSSCSPPSKATKNAARKASSKKLKISNELKNLAIEMSTSNTSLDEVIQQDGLIFGMKTSICEMVKTKGRSCSAQSTTPTLSAQQSTPTTVQVTTITKKPSAELKTQPEAAVATSAEIHNNTATNSDTKAADAVAVEQTTKSLSEQEQSTPEKIAQEAKLTLEAVKTVGLKNGSKISALVKAKHAKMLESLSNKRVESSNETLSVTSDDNSEKVTTVKSFNTSSSSATAAVDKKKSKKAEGDAKAEPLKNDTKSEAKLNVKVVKTSKSAQVESKKAVNKKKLPPSTTTTNTLQPEKSIKSKTAENKSSNVDSKASENSKKSSSDAGITKTSIEPTSKSSIPVKTPKKTTEKSKQSKKAEQLDNSKSPPLTPTKALNPKKNSPEKRESSAKQMKKSKLTSTAAEVKKEKVDTTTTDDSEEATIDTDSDSDSSDDSTKTFKKPAMPPVKRNLRQKLDKESTSKRARVASLNAAAKVHFLYENEAAAIAKAIKQSLEEQQTLVSKASVKSDIDDADDDDDEDEDADEERKPSSTDDDFISQR